LLIIDDNATNRCVLRKITERWQMQPEEAASGAEGLEKLEESFASGHPYRLVLLDQQMPDIDWLRGRSPGSRASGMAEGGMRSYDADLRRPELDHGKVP
jgi:CheY-like chemotaxis protein